MVAVEDENNVVAAVDYDGSFGRSVGFCNRHNAGAALVAPRFGGPGTPGAQRAERGTVVHCVHVVDF